MTTTSTLADHGGPDAQAKRVGEGTNTRNSQSGNGTQRRGAVAGPKGLNGQVERDTQRLVAVEPPAPQLAIHQSATNVSTPVGDLNGGDHGPSDTQSATVAAPTPLGPARPPSSPMTRSLDLADPLLALAADVVDDLEKVRIANTNRLAQLTRDQPDKDGLERGFGLTHDHPDVARLAALVNALAKAEHDAVLNLQRMVRQHPLGPWIKQAKGVGEKQAARLLAAIGDPYWNDLHNRPRLVSELWAFCGYAVHKLPVSQVRLDAHNYNAGGEFAGGSPDQTTRDTHINTVGTAVTRQRGMKSNWSPTAKMRAYLIAESCKKTAVRAPCIKANDTDDDYAIHNIGCRCSPYRVLYDHGRKKYADATHKLECKRCGPTGKPAAIGSPLSAGHKQSRALRFVAKTLLKDLWHEAKRLHQEA